MDLVHIWAKYEKPGQYNYFWINLVIRLQIKPIWSQTFYIFIFIFFEKIKN